MKNEITVKTVISTNMIPLCILEILERHSDFNHKLTQIEIMNYLHSEYQVEKIERKAVSRSIERLREEMEIPIESDRKGSWIDGRKFENEELQMLIDAVFTSRYISKKQTEDLIDKLKSLGNEFFESNVKYTYSTDDLAKTENKTLFYSINRITEAIEKHKQITFDYNRYGADRKLHKTSSHQVSPYRLIVHNQRYYIMAYHEKFKNLIYYRLDHITNVRLADEKATPITTLPGWKGGITNKNMAQNLPYMFSDKQEQITFYATEWAIDQMIDWLGFEVQIADSAESTDGRVKLTVKTSPTAMKYFAFQYMEHVEVLEPQHLREEIIQDMEKALTKYKK